MAISQSAKDVIQSIIRWADAHESIRATLLTSTRAIPGAEVDVLSDYDVILVVQDIFPFVIDHSWLNEFGNVLVAYWDEIHPDPVFGINICANVIQYSNGLKIDFTLWPVPLLKQVAIMPILPAELEAGYLVLGDKDRLTHGMRLPTGKAYIPDLPSLKTYRNWINDFLSDAPYVAKCLWRNELIPAKWCLDYDMKHVYLRRVLEWRVEIDQDWSLPVGSLGKGLKKQLPADIWLALEQTYVGSSMEANWKALRLTMELFRRISIEVGIALGYAYPEDLHQKVNAYIDLIMELKFIGSNVLPG